MEKHGATGWETAVLDGGPAHGLRVRVADRPQVLQVSYPCPPEESPGGELPGGELPGGVRVQALHIYRRDPRGPGGPGGPVRYGFDPASP
ncbi:hypothetical protein ACIQGZ_02050 [Streptomyces sp. NPDC092296]|uniref:hypothetical protein n=1 Tax=Streptomyces sp. NPDC092296 TaxID=3366012 RepID=UPI003813A318